MLGLLRSYFDRMALRAVHRAGARVDRYKLARRSYVREQLLNDVGIQRAVAAHAAEKGISEAEAWRVVDRYIDEIVPFFNIIAYYHLGYRAAGWLLNLFYKVSVEYEDRAKHEQLPRDGSRQLERRLHPGHHRRRPRWRVEPMPTVLSVQQHPSRQALRSRGDGLM